MIRVTIDLWPGGDPDRCQTLHVIDVWNDLGDHRASRGRLGSYGYRISRKFRNSSDRAPWQRKGAIRGFPRTRLNAVRLLQRVLNDAYPVKGE